MEKKVFMKTWGCQMNGYDTLRALDSLTHNGYRQTPRPETATLILLNTCHIREKASEKLFSELGRFHQLKKKTGARIAVMGCVAQAQGEEILSRAPFVDIVCGPQTYHRLDALLEQAVDGPVIDISFPLESKFDFLPKETVPRSVCGFVTVQEGCDKFCSFCVVPYTRGAEASRPLQAIKTEVERLIDGGAREITLLGQNVNAYHGLDPSGQECSLAGLLYALAEIDGLERLRYTTSHPRDMTLDLIQAHRDLHCLMPWLHLPLQSGSDRILKAMNRRHTVAFYRRLIDQLRQARPDIAFSSDFIVGYPDERETDFQQTLALVKDVEYSQAYSFMYSPRLGTPAETKPQLPQTVKRDRLERLQTLLKQQQQAFNQRFVGRRLPVLFDRQGKQPNQWLGRTPYMQVVHAHAPESLIGSCLEVDILRAGPNSLESQIAS